MSDRIKDKGTRTQSAISGLVAGLTSRFVIAPLDVVKIRLQLQSHAFAPSKKKYDSLPASGQDLGGGRKSMTTTAARAAPPLSAPSTASTIPSTAAATAASASSTPLHYEGPLATARRILAREGIRAFWKGNLPAEALYASYTGIQFITYRTTTVTLHRLFGPETLPHAVQSFIAGAVGGATSTTATYPLDLLRTRFAAQGTQRVYPSLRKAVVEIFRDEGPRGFFRGLAPTLVQIIPYMGVFFMSFEGLRHQFRKRTMTDPSASSQGSGGSDAMAGGLASIVAKTTVFPLDVVRKRMQVQGPTRTRYVYHDIPEYRQGTIAALRTILVKEGVRGLYKGLPIALVKSAPSSTVTVWVYGRMMTALLAWEEKHKDLA